MKLHQLTAILLLSLSIPVLFTVSCELVNSSGSPGLIDWEDGEQIVPADDEQLDEKVRELYREDAEKLAVRYINGEDSTQTEIPEELIELFYNGLIHIVNDDHPKVKEVTEEFDIHARTPAGPRTILVHVDTSAPWIDAWQNEETKTGDSEIDALIEEFDLTLVAYSESEHASATGLATLRSNRALNVYAVGTLFEELSHIKSAGPDEVTDGSDIGVLFFSNRLMFSFNYGFGDCPSGCINRHQWFFNVFKDGTVEFVDEEGDPLP